MGAPFVMFKKCTYLYFLRGMVSLFCKMQVYAGIGCKLQTDEVASVMVADRAEFGN